MGSGYSRVALLFGAFALGLVVTACGRAGSPLTPTSPAVEGSVDARPPTTSLCHYDEASGDYFALELTTHAVAAHRRHGDGAVGDVVPGQADMVFGDDCVPVPAEDTYTLTCGAPPTPINPGSTTPPGPVLDTTRGAQTIQYMVTASPVPPAGSSVQWSVYLDGLLVSPLVMRPLDDLSGAYTQFGHGVGMAGSSGVFEVRFDFDESTCSLYWDLNPHLGD